MKWWWIIGLICIGALFQMNEVWYGNAAKFGVPIGMIIATLISMKYLRDKHRTGFGVLFACLIGMAIWLAIPTYSVAEAKQKLTDEYGEVTYAEGTGLMGDSWNPFASTYGYVFKTSSGKKILFIPDSGKSFEI